MEAGASQEDWLEGATLERQARAMLLTRLTIELTRMCDVLESDYRKRPRYRGNIPWIPCWSCEPNDEMLTSGRHEWCNASVDARTAWKAVGTLGYARRNWTSSARSSSDGCGTDAHSLGRFRHTRLDETPGSAENDPEAVSRYFWKEP